MALKISSKGWVVIPAKLRRKYKLQEGSEVRIVDYGGVLSFVPVEADPVAFAAGMLRGDGDLTAALLEEHAKELLGE
ncbi:MAG: AbrB/MazE/SpoVT family DNA-binding domain-containing protein [Anaerolineae bacterium]|nr:AbrB/MazE/SpoVT family DNA-binding domain-containing protein [Anaerolineae bacterium]